KKAVELDPAFSLAWARLAWAAKYTHNDEDARRYIANARRFSSGAAGKELLAIAAIEAELTGNLDEGIARWQRLLEQYPEDKEAMFAIGDIALHRNDFGTAREYFRRTLRLDPDHVHALDHLVLTSILSGEQISVADAERLAKQAPSLNSLNFLSRAYYAVGRDA